MRSKFLVEIHLCKLCVMCDTPIARIAGCVCAYEYNMKKNEKYNLAVISIKRGFRRNSALQPACDPSIARVTECLRQTDSSSCGIQDA